MPKFKSIEYRNIQSVGNHPIKIQLDRHPTTLIGGLNGAGKSTFLMAFTYCLFGKFISGVKLGDAINSVNKKKLLVEVEFTERGDEYRVIRGEKPKKFEIYKNDELLDQNANSRDQQKTLEIILGMDYKVFTQIVVLNKERYVPFMEMGAGDRRKVVEDILGISIFSEMNEVCKNRIRENQREASTVEREYEVKKTEIQGQQKLYDQIQESIREASKDLQGEIDSTKTELDQSKKRLEETQEALNAINLEGHEKVKKQKCEFEKLASQFETQISQAKKHASFFEVNDHCPTCEQDIEEGLKERKRKESEEEVNRVQNVIAEMMGELEKVVQQDNDFKEREQQSSELFGEVNQRQYEVRSLEKQLDSLLRRSASTADEEKLDEAATVYAEMERSLESLRERQEVLIRKGETLACMRDMLKDDGIKAVIVKEYIALMNKKINEYLQAMNFYINMTIDENFKESFHAMHKESFSMSNLSTGQKTRVNLAIWLAFLEVASIKNSVVSNVLFLDEILENLDSEGAKDFMVLCNEKLPDKNIFVVTQRYDEFMDMFRSSIRFKLNEGFTEMEV